MKIFYLMLAGFCFTTTSYSQAIDTLIKSFPRLYYKSPTLPTWPTQNKTWEIYSLPLDNMPCIVANLKNVTPIPTKKLYRDNLRMPNKIPE